MNKQMHKVVAKQRKLTYLWQTKGCAIFTHNSQGFPNLIHLKVQKKELICLTLPK